jgi:hypothetical protein
MKLELENLVFIFKGYTSKRHGNIPKQVVIPKRINCAAKSVSVSVITSSGRYYTSAFGFNRFEVFSHDDPAAILYKPMKAEL